MMNNNNPFKNNNMMMNNNLFGNNNTMGMNNMNNNLNNNADYLSAQIFQISHQSENQSNMNYMRSGQNNLFG